MINLIGFNPSFFLIKFYIICSFADLSQNNDNRWFKICLWSIGIKNIIVACIYVLFTGLIKISYNWISKS